jgi:hypothetical protein
LKPKVQWGKKHRVSRMVKLTLYWIACWRPGQAISAQKTHPQSEWNDLKRPPKSSVSEWMRKRGWKGYSFQGKSESRMLGNWHVRFGGEGSKTWHSNVLRRTALTLIWTSGFLKVLLGVKPPFWPPPMAAAARIFFENGGYGKHWKVFR